jgi:hypothetical protein
MVAEVRYYAIVTGGSAAQPPTGLARRTFVADGPVDETLRDDLTWQADSAIVEWEYGDLGADLVQVSEQQAEQILASLRAKLNS